MKKAAITLALIAAVASAQAQEREAPLIAPQTLASQHGVNPFTGKMPSVADGALVGSPVSANASLPEGDAPATKTASIPSQGAPALSSQGQTEKQERTATKQVMPLARSHANAKSSGSTANKKMPQRPVSSSVAGASPSVGSKVCIDVATGKPATPTEMPRIELKTIVGFYDSRSAIVELNGQSFVVSDGSETPFGVVRILDNRSILVSGKMYHLPL